MAPNLGNGGMVNSDWMTSAQGRVPAEENGPFQSFYQACLARGMKPHLARLTQARKIAAITLLVWKKGARFDAEHLKRQAA